MLSHSTRLQNKQQGGNGSFPFVRQESCPLCSLRRGWHTPVIWRLVDKSFAKLFDFAHKKLIIKIFIFGCGTWFSLLRFRGIVPRWPAAIYLSSGVQSSHWLGTRWRDTGNRVQDSYYLFFSLILRINSSVLYFC